MKQTKAANILELLDKHVEDTNALGFACSCGWVSNFDKGDWYWHLGKTLFKAGQRWERGYL